MNFYQWWETVEYEYKEVVSEDVARAAFKAGMLHCADIADKKTKNCCIPNTTCEEYDHEECIHKEQGYCISYEIRKQEKLIN